MKSRFAVTKILNNFMQAKSPDINFKEVVNSFFDNYSFSDMDRNFIYDISKGTIRHLIKIDYIISLFSKIDLEKLDNDILNIIRMSVYQLFYTDRIPSYSILNEAVDIAKKAGGRYSAGFVNAVLRKISNIDHKEKFSDEIIKKNITDPFERISVLYSFPKWIIDYWKNDYDIVEIEKICKSLNEPGLNYIRINKCRTSKDELKNIYLKEKIQEPENIHNPESGFDKKDLFEDTLVLKNMQNLSSEDSFRKGLFTVQDFSSQFAVKYFLKPSKNQRILDLCGAPGGKATYISELTGGKIEIISIDINENKKKLFYENIARLGTKGINLYIKDVTRENYLNGNNKYENYFDKILIDPPCTAFGTISKNPDVKYRKSIGDIKRLSKISRKMLENSLRYLKPGGFTVFYTCTISKEENQQTIKNFIHENHSKLQIINTYEIKPYFFKSEGGFISVIKKSE
jgi:16S rRNA (cytosine967-C5)-methyltransferase